MENREENINLIAGRIIDEYRKHPDLEWYKIAASKIHSQWFEYYENQNKQLLDEIEKTKQFNLELIYSNKFKDKEIEMLKFQLKAADSVNEQYRIGLIEIKQSLTENRQKIIEAINQPK